jgi:hypothetical protein
LRAPTRTPEILDNKHESKLLKKVVPVIRHDVWDRLVPED